MGSCCRLTTRPIRQESRDLPWHCCGARNSRHCERAEPGAFQQSLVPSENVALREVRYLPWTRAHDELPNYHDPWPLLCLESTRRPCTCARARTAASSHASPPVRQITTGGV